MMIGDNRNIFYGFSCYYKITFLHFFLKLYAELSVIVSIYPSSNKHLTFSQISKTLLKVLALDFSKYHLHTFCIMSYMYKLYLFITKNICMEIDYIFQKCCCGKISPGEQLFHHYLHFERKPMREFSKETQLRYDKISVCHRHSV